MEKVSDVLKTPVELLQSQVAISVGGEDSGKVTEQMVANVNKVFATIHVSYPAWYEKYYSTPKIERQAKRIWLAGIKLLTTEQVIQGLKLMVMECDFPPRLKEFMSLCQRVDGLVDIELAWCEALIGHYSHPIIKTAAELTGIFELKQASYDSITLKKRFEYYFGKVRDNFSQGKALQDVKKWQNKNDDYCALELVELQAEKRVKERIKQQGISIQNARAECLALVGIKYR